MKPIFHAIPKSILFVLSALLSFSCGNEDPLNPYLMESGNINIAGENYRLNSAKYFSGYYPFVDEECINMYLQFSQGAGITVELSKELLNKRVVIEKSDSFWFFSIGNGQGFSERFENGDDDLSDVKGWFQMTCDEGTDECSLLFRLDSASGSHIASGRIVSIFERKESL